MMAGLTTSLRDREPPRPGFTRTYRLLVRGKNISAETLLATDYLNHINEVVMLIELLGSAPEFWDDVRAWRPRSYAEHFRQSGFADRELAVLAYDQAPLVYRLPFDGVIAEIDAAILGGVAAIERAMGASERDLIVREAEATAATARALVDQASAIIHGQSVSQRQDAIDALLG
jgi:hypothetical protein